MLSVSNLLCRHEAGNETLRYSHISAGGTPKPVVVWAVTRACNLRCVHCYASATAGPAQGELTREEGFELLDDLKQFGVPAVLFSGGEPLARPDILELIDHARSIQLPSTLSTNGTLIDEDMADKLAVLGLRYVGISIDGIGQTHDKLRGVQGAFEKSMAAIDRCRARGMRVGVRFTVHALNCAYLDEIFDLCREHQVQRLCIYHLAYSGRGGKMQKVDLSPEATRATVNRIFERTRKCHDEGWPLEVLTVDNHADAAYLLMNLEQNDPERARTVHDMLARTGGNRSGCNIAAIDYAGGVHYDQFSWHYSCGNVRQRRFSTIWSQATDPRLAILRHRKPFLPWRCRECRFLDVCNGNLRTRAEAATGSWLGQDPACYLTDAEIGVGETALAGT